MAVDFVTQKLTYFDKSYRIKKMSNSGTRSKSLLEEYVKNPNIDVADIIGMAGDMLLAGIDTVE